MKDYSMTEVAELLNRSRQYVWLKIKSGGLRAIKVGSFYVIKGEELKRFMNSTHKLLNSSDTFPLV